MKRIGLAFVGVVLLSSWSLAAPIRVRLFYAGLPLTYLAHPDITLRGPQGWISSQVTQNADGSYSMVRPGPGAYMIHVVIDENKSNPGDYPGDYNIFQDFQVTDSQPVELIVHMSKLIHVTAPWDNGKGIDGMLTGSIAQQPLLDMPPLSFKREIVLTWEPVTEGAEYRYTLSHTENGEVTQLFQKDTSETSVTVRLPPSQPGQVYQFNLFARKNGQTIGTLFVHDAGALGWSMSFRVGPARLTVGKILAVVGVLLVCGILLMKYPGILAWGVSGLLLLVLGVFLFIPKKQTPTLGGGSSASQAQAPAPARAGVDHAVVEEFKRSVPLPEWWNQVEPELPIRDFSELQSVWMSGGTMDTDRGKRFYKSAYKAIDEHPEIPDLVPVGMYLMSVVAADSNTQTALQKFWLDKFYLYRQRVDNCAHCSEGDTIATMVRSYAENFVQTDPDQAIALTDRLFKERAADVSDWSQAATLAIRAQALWTKADKPGAIADLEKGLQIYPAGGYADQLRHQLERYRASEPTPFSPSTGQALKPLTEIQKR
jgi:hypothetical protein